MSNQSVVIRVGAAFCTAVFIQGAYFYLKYAGHHKTQPYPGTPASGVVKSRKRRIVTNDKSYRVLVVGDSLAVGVGCGAVKLPSLPVALALGLSERLGGAEIQWTSIGIVGADATETNELLRKALLECSYDVVVVMVGLNDIRRWFLPWTRKPGSKSSPNSPSAFESELTTMVKTVRKLCGINTQIVFPALPISFSPVLAARPLSLFLTPLFQLWDKRKRVVSEKMSRVQFLEAPSHSDMKRRLTRLGVTLKMQIGQMLISPDQIHPNHFGYHAWGSHIADSLDLEGKSAGVHVPLLHMSGSHLMRCLTGLRDRHGRRMEY